MGNNIDKMKMQDWEIIQKKQKMKILKNKKDGKLVQEYHLTIFNQQEKHKQLNFYQKRKNMANVIEVLMTRQENNSLFVYIQKLSCRLSQLFNLQQNKAKYILLEALKGFKLLYQKYGPFQIQDNMIGIDLKNNIKVWLNDNFAYNHPFPSNNFNNPSQNNQNYMVNKIINCIQKHIYNATFNYFFRQQLFSNGPHLTFNNTINFLSKLNIQKGQFNLNKQRSKSFYHQLPNNSDFQRLNVRTEYNSVIGKNQVPGQFQKELYNQRNQSKSLIFNRNMMNTQLVNINKEVKNPNQILSQRFLNPLNQKFNNYGLQNEKGKQFNNQNSIRKTDTYKKQYINNQPPSSNPNENPASSNQYIKNVNDTFISPYRNQFEKQINKQQPPMQQQQLGSQFTFGKSQPIGHQFTFGISNNQTNQQPIPQNPNTLTDRYYNPNQNIPYIRGEPIQQKQFQTQRRVQNLPLIKENVNMSMRGNQSQISSNQQQIRSQQGQHQNVTQQFKTNVQIPSHIPNPYKGFLQGQNDPQQNQGKVHQEIKQSQPQKFMQNQYQVFPQGQKVVPQRQLNIQIQPHLPNQFKLHEKNLSEQRGFQMSNKYQQQKNMQGRFHNPSQGFQKGINQQKGTNQFQSLNIPQQWQSNTQKQKMNTQGYKLQEIPVISKQIQGQSRDPNKPKDRISFNVLKDMNNIVDQNQQVFSQKIQNLNDMSYYIKSENQQKQNEFKHQTLSQGIIIPPQSQKLSDFNYQQMKQPFQNSKKESDNFQKEPKPIKIIETKMPQIVNRKNQTNFYQSKIGQYNPTDINKKNKYITSPNPKNIETIISTKINYGLQPKQEHFGFNSNFDKNETWNNTNPINNQKFISNQTTKRNYLDFHWKSSDQQKKPTNQQFEPYKYQNKEQKRQWVIQDYKNIYPSSLSNSQQLKNLLNVDGNSKKQSTQEILFDSQNEQTDRQKNKQIQNIVNVFRKENQKNQLNNHNQLFEFNQILKKTNTNAFQIPNRQIPSQFQKNYVFQIPKQSQKTYDFQIPKQSQKNYALQIPKQSENTNVFQKPKQSQKSYAFQMPKQSENRNDYQIQNRTNTYAFQIPKQSQKKYSFQIPKQTNTNVYQKPKQSQKTKSIQIPYQSKNINAFQIAKQSQKTYAFQIPKQSQKSYAFQIPKQSQKNYSFQIPKQSENTNAFLIPKQSQKNYEFLIPKQSQKNYEFQIPKQSQKNYAFQIPRQSQKNYAFQIPKQSQKNYAFQIPKQSQKTYAFQIPKQSQKNYSFQIPKQSESTNAFQISNRTNSYDFQKKIHVFQIPKQSQNTNVLQLPKQQNSYVFQSTIKTQKDNYIFDNFKANESHTNANYLNKPFQQRSFSFQKSKQIIPITHTQTNQSSKPLQSNTFYQHSRPVQSLIYSYEKSKPIQSPIFNQQSSKPVQSSTYSYGSSRPFESNSYKFQSTNPVLSHYYNLESQKPKQQILNDQSIKSLQTKTFTHQINMPPISPKIGQLNLKTNTFQKNREQKINLTNNYKIQQSKYKSQLFKTDDKFGKNQNSFVSSDNSNKFNFTTIKLQPLSQYNKQSQFSSTFQNKVQMKSDNVTNFGLLNYSDKMNIPYTTKQQTFSHKESDKLTNNYNTNQKNPINFDIKEGKEQLTYSFGYMNMKNTPTEANRTVKSFFPSQTKRNQYNSSKGYKYQYDRSSFGNQPSGIHFNPELLQTKTKNYEYRYQPVINQDQYKLYDPKKTKNKQFLINRYDQNKDFQYEIQIDQQIKKFYAQKMTKPGQLPYDLAQQRESVFLIEQPQQ